MDIDDFMAHGLDSSGNDDAESASDEQSSEEDEKVAQKNSGKKKTAQSHKQSLERLKKQDPEFYKFLQKEDKDLLNFNPNDISGSEEEDDDDDEVEMEAEESSDDGRSDEEYTHKLPEKLEAATDSEESESEDEEKPKKKVKAVSQNVVTVKMVNQWSKSLDSKPSFSTIHECITAFKAAVVQANPEESAHVKYKVEGSTVFNAIVRVCLAQVPPSLDRLLNLSAPKEGKKIALPSTSNKWKKARMDIKSYIGDVMQLMSDVADPSILNVILKHIHVMVPYYACFPKQMRVLLKKLFTTWSTAEETSRVLAFLSINKILRMRQETLLEFTIKQMYMAYVQNCKFTSPTSLPLINFMQRSLVEVLSLDVTLTYQYAFIYIRQLAIHLRNAITVKKTESNQAVYNWQYIHSLHLWSRLLSQLHPNDTLQPLIYPLTQTIIGTIKLVPTAKFFPLRFHCVRALNMLSGSTSTFIPILPFLTEVFELTDFNKRHKASSFKPINFACVLKLSKAQLTEKGFRDGAIEQLCEHMLESLNIYAHTVAFPELCLPAMVQLKKFIKQCKVSNYTKQIKQVIEKVEETSKVISQRRRTAAMNLNDHSSVVAWETRSQQEGTPLGKYYTTWKKMRTRQIQAEIAQKDKISIDNLPKLNKKPGPMQPSDKKQKEFRGILETDSEDSGSDSDDETRFLLKEERNAKKQKVAAAAAADSDDEYSDFDDDELDQLAKSASEDEEDEDVEEEEDVVDDDDDDDEDDDDGAEEADDIVEEFKFSSDEED